MSTIQLVLDPIGAAVNQTFPKLRGEVLADQENIRQVSCVGLQELLRIVAELTRLFLR